MELYHVLIPYLLLQHSGSALYTSDNHVIELTSENFEELVLKSDEVWIVEFYASWCIYCQNFADEYARASEALKGVVKVGAIDADVHKELPGRYGVRGLPTLKVFGANKMQPEDANAARNSKQLIEIGLAAVKALVLNRLTVKERDSLVQGQADDSFVAELTDQNFERLVAESNDVWMVEFYAHWCGHCKALDPHWSAAANELSGKIRFGKLDGSVNKKTVNDYDITAYPTIKLFMPGVFDTIDYNGGRRSEDIVEWVTKKLENHRGPSQILGENSLRQSCENKNYCVLAFLPSSLTCRSACRYEYLDVLEETSREFGGQLWGWVWSEANHQSDLEHVFKLHEEDFPVLVAADYKNGVFAVHRAQFTVDKIYEFLRKLMDGRAKFQYIFEDNFPEIYNITAWDGTDGADEIDEFYSKDEL